MATALKEIEAKIRSLKPEERTRLLRSLIAELDGPSEANVERRVKTVPEKQVLEKVRSRLKR